MASIFWAWRSCASSCWRSEMSRVTLTSASGSPVADRARREGHEIASHGCGHFDGGAWTASDWKAEFRQFESILAGAWSLNLDVKKLWLNTDVKANLGGTALKADVDLNPWIFGVGVGYRF